MKASATESGPLSIGVLCHHGFGGSGVVATEVGLAMAARGHQVHFVCTGTPPRLIDGAPNLTVHIAEAAPYAALQAQPYPLALASKLIEVAKTHGLDLIHSHYAVPHAVTAWMAQAALGDRVKTVATVHGTDITLLGDQPSYHAITRHALQNTDAITAPSAFLRAETLGRFGLDRPTTVIPNFVDGDTFRPTVAGESNPLTEIFGGDGGPPVLVHVSNFRAVKRPVAVVEVFARVLKQTPARLLLIGDGPERAAVDAAVERLGVQAETRNLGPMRRFEPILRHCELFLLPSRNESFGLAALEALASGVPVVASDVGGLPEVIQHGVTGVLVPPDDLDAMAAETIDLLTHPDARNAMARAARADVLDRFCPAPLVDRYEALYRSLLG